MSQTLSDSKGMTNQFIYENGVEEYRSTGMTFATNFFNMAREKLSPDAEYFPIEQVLVDLSAYDARVSSLRLFS